MDDLTLRSPRAESRRMASRTWTTVNVVYSFFQSFNPLLSLCEDYLRLSKAMCITSKAQEYGRAKCY
jgi:hypothetical protein